MPAQLDLFAPRPLPPAPAVTSEGGIPRLRDYQVDVADRACTDMARGLKWILIQGETGCGKGHVIGSFAHCGHAVGARVLILADRRRIVRQLGGVLDQFRVPYGMVMSGESRHTDRPVLLASRDTLAAWDARGLTIPPPRLVITDEAHKSPGPTYQHLYSLFPEAVHLGLTATPARNDGKALDFWQSLQCVVPASRLIAEGWLVKPEVYAPLELAGRRKSGARTRGLAGDPVTHWLRHADGLPTIAFAASVKESTALRDRFLKAGIPAEHIDQATPDRERDAACARLAARKTLVLCSVGLLIEGVDIPEAACALLWAKFGSVVAYRQACGRIMRPAAGKARAVVLDHSGAAGVHGLPGDDLEWSLDGGSTVGARLKKARAKGDVAPTVFCQKCGLGFPASAPCPGCGWKPRTRRTPSTAGTYAARDEVLSRYEGEGAAERQAETRQRYWKRCVGMAVNGGRAASAAAAMFRRQFGVGPEQAKVSPLPSSRGDWAKPAWEVFQGFKRRA